MDNETPIWKSVGTAVRGEIFCSDLLETSPFGALFTNSYLTYSQSFWPRSETHRFIQIFVQRKNNFNNVKLHMEPKRKLKPKSKKKTEKFAN